MAECPTRAGQKRAAFKLEVLDKMTDTDRLLAVVRQFPGMRASAAFHRAGLKLSNNYRATLVFNARRDGLLAPSVKGERWGRLYPAESSVSDGSVFASSCPTVADPDGGAVLGRLGAPGLLDAISDLVEPFSPEEQVLVDRALAKIAASRAVRGAF